MKLRRDLVATAALSAFGAIGVVALPDAAPVKIGLAALLVLCLPGYALTAVLFPGRAFGWEYRLLLAVALSVAVSVVVGLLLNLTPLGLRGESWAVSLAAFTCASCFAAGRLWPDGGFAFPRLGRVRRLEIALLAAAALVLTGAVALARTPLSAPNAQGYTALWLLPGTAGSTTGVRVGVASGELRPTSYRLVVRSGGTTLYSQRLRRLRPGGRFRVTLALPRASARKSVTALLYLDGRPKAPYRVVELQPRAAT
jgi:uncharacterized membrane protein